MSFSTLSVHQENKISVVKVTEKRIFLKVADDFKEQMLSVLDSGTTDILIDLSDVHVMNSSGIGVLMLVRDKIEKRKGRLVLCDIQPIMQEIFSRMHLDTFFNIAADRTVALEFFK
ncbi:STAS domain-containing protein [candidate division KSB1 bacterium]|nr:STAS domain-containing protein [candidate division KSB1 bacterium]